jgi:nucleotide-binding universal stress UspA family protein
MKERMKILIAYDGSECAQAALDDLKRAGLPRAAEVRVLSVYDAWMPVPTSFGMVETDFPQQHLRDGKATLALARQAAAKIQSMFPGWDVNAEAGVGSPGSVIVEQADIWKPDLLITGSHGRTALGRLFLGSVSQQLVSEARCSVRVARGRVVESEQTPVRILIGIDGSKGADAALKAVAARHWPAGSEARVINGAWSFPPIASDRQIGRIEEWIVRETARVKEMTEAAQRRLQAAGLKTSSIVKEEEPKRLLVQEAENWGADCIFVGARGMGRLERFLIGSVSASVAARAHCSVEVVRANG